MRVDDRSAAVEQTIDALKIGSVVEQVYAFTSDDIDRFGALAGDHAAVHFDDGYAQAMGFSHRIVHGFLVSSRFSRLLGMHLPGPRSVIQSIQLSFLKPVHVDQPILFRVAVVSLTAAVGAVGLELLASRIADEQTVTKGKASCILRSSHPA